MNVFLDLFHTSSFKHIPPLLDWRMWSMTQGKAEMIEFMIVVFIAFSQINLECQLGINFKDKLNRVSFLDNTRCVSCYVGITFLRFYWKTTFNPIRIDLISCETSSRSSNSSFCMFCIFVVNYCPFLMECFHLAQLLWKSLIFIVMDSFENFIHGLTLSLCLPFYLHGRNLIRKQSRAAFSYKIMV